MTALAFATSKGKYCVLTSVALAFLSLVPQIHLWAIRGHEWHGMYVSPQGDEFFYSGYVNALIHGRTRKNDPFGAQDDSSDSPLPESIFSIQSVPAYVVAFAARILGVSASTAFILILPSLAAIASCAIFWLLNYVTGRERIAVAGTLLVLCFGCLVGRNGIFGTFVDVGPAAFPYLRRYQPALPFPLFFIFQIFIWRVLQGEEKWRYVFSLLAAFTLALLVFSHLYLWTAAAAWFASISLLWFLFRPGDRRQLWAPVLIVSGLLIVTLVPYVTLLSRRASTLDQQQILVSTHQPDLFRLHEVLGGIIVLIIIWAVVRRHRRLSDSRALYAASLALLPIIVFNQQVITGRTLQSLHFEVGVVNYSTLVGLVVAISFIKTQISRPVLIGTVGVCLIWALVAVALPARFVFVPQAIETDRAVPVLLRLNDLSKKDGTFSELRKQGLRSTLVFSPDVLLITVLPTWTSQGTLLDSTGVDCRAMTRTERKGRFFMHLYYSKVSAEELRSALSGPNKSRRELASAQTVIFGYERTSPALTPDFRPIRSEEVDREVQNYQTYLDSFSHEEALTRPIKYAVIPADGNFDFSNLDRWYERDAGERVGDHVLYVLKLK